MHLAVVVSFQYHSHIHIVLTLNCLLARITVIYKKVPFTNIVCEQKCIVVL